MKVDPCKRLLWVCAGFCDPSIPVGEEGTSIAFVNGMTTATLAEGQLYVIKSLLTAGDAASAFPFRIIRVDLSLFDEP